MPNEKILLTYLYTVYIEELIEFIKELLHNQTNAVISVGLETLVLLRIYIKLIDIDNVVFLILRPLFNTVIILINIILKKN